MDVVREAAAVVGKISLAAFGFVLALILLFLIAAFLKGCFRGIYHHIHGTPITEEKSPDSPANRQ